MGRHVLPNGTLRRDLRYLYQLRVGLSPLRAHKFRHNFLDTPSDKCMCQTGTESTIHFLLQCPLFNVHREDLMNKIQPIVSNLPHVSEHPTLCNILLYGSKNLDPPQNKEILNTTLIYIRSTGRFSGESSTWEVVLGNLGPPSRALCLFLLPFQFLCVIVPGM